jgi:hypothetical protein
MSRTQHSILIAGSSLVILFLLLQVVFARQAQYAQAHLLAAQQVITDGRSCDVRLRQLAARIYQLGQQTQDQGLKDILARQQISVQSAPATNAAPAQPMAAPVQR